MVLDLIEGIDRGGVTSDKMPIPTAMHQAFAQAATIRATMLPETVEVCKVPDGKILVNVEFPPTHTFQEQTFIDLDQAARYLWAFGWLYGNWESWG